MTSRYRTILMPLALLCALAAGCGDDQGAGGTTSTDPASTVPTTGPTTGPPQSTTMAPVPTTGPTTTRPMPDDPGSDNAITEADDGEQFSAAVGEEMPLRLSSEWAWELSSVSGDAVSLVQVDYLVDPGYFEWIIEMVAPGTAEITTSGTPNCGDPAACPDRSVAFTIDVEG